MKTYDPTILFPTIISAIAGMILICASRNINDPWLSGLLIGLGINVSTISVTLVLVDIYKWLNRKRIYKQSYEILKINLLGILSHEAVWLMGRYAKDEKARDLLIRSVKYSNEDSVSTVTKYISDELIKLERDDVNFGRIQGIDTDEAKWLHELIRGSKNNLNLIMDLYSHLVDDPELIDLIAKLRGNMNNALTATNYLAGDSRIPMNQAVACDYIKYMFRSYVGIIRYLKSL